jgi:DNA-binding NarL/FixJ family response regulator
MSPIDVVITERLRAGRTACRSLLGDQEDIRIVAEAGTGLGAVSAVARLQPHVLVLDTELVSDASSLLPLIRRESPLTRVLLLTDQTTDGNTLDTLSHGARGYLDRAELTVHLPRAVRAVAAGQAWVPRGMVASIMDRLVRLTHRGREMPPSCSIA